jgi:hypothetical protein
MNNNNNNNNNNNKTLVKVFALKYLPLVQQTKAWRRK